MVFDVCFRRRLFRTGSHSLLQEPVNPLHQPGESRRLYQNCQPQVEVVSEIVEKIPGFFPTEPRLPVRQSEIQKVRSH